MQNKNEILKVLTGNEKGYGLASSIVGLELEPRRIIVLLKDREAAKELNAKHGHALFNRARQHWPLVTSLIFKAQPIARPSTPSRQQQLDFFEAAAPLQCSGGKHD